VAVDSVEPVTVAVDPGELPAASVHPEGLLGVAVDSVDL
jgi:hypothetical protein